MEKKTGEGIGKSLADFANDVGIPDQLLMDLDPTQSGKHTALQAEAQRLQIKVMYFEKGCSEQNHTAEGEIGQVKK